jgi:cilia- and flagella-associated protein 300
MSTKEIEIDVVRGEDVDEKRSEMSRFFEMIEPRMNTLRKYPELCKKWNLDGTHTSLTFKMTSRWNDDDTEKFVVDFFNDKEVRKHFQVAATKGRTSLLGNAKSATFEKLRTNVTNMKFFDRLRDVDIVAKSGYIRKCMEEDFEGVAAGDKLRRMLVDEDDEEYCLYDDEEKQELIFHIFKRLVIGGSMCQWEDEIKEYEKLTKEIYRELLTVHKSQSTGGVEISTIALNIKDIEGLSIFPNESEHNFCYLCVDSIQSQVTVWYGAFVPYW